MGANTKIEWCDFTFNHVRGCTKVSEGCRNCYADSMSKRNPRTLGVWGPNGTRVVAAEKTWFDPVRWNAAAGWWCDSCHSTCFGLQNKPGSTADSCRGCGHPCRRPVGPERPRVFCASLADVFEDWRGEMVNSNGEVIDGLSMEMVRDRVFALMAITPNLDWLTLTKRPEEMVRYISDHETAGRVAKIADSLLVADAAAAVPERIEPYPNFPGYYVSNHGFVMTTSGTLACLQCGAAITGDPRKKFCGSKCKSTDHYQRKQGAKVAADVPVRFVKLSPDVGEQGHERVTLYRDTQPHRVLVHRAVLSVFDCLPLAPEWQGCHRDGNPRNNHIVNLRWGTQEDNWADRKRHGNGRSYSKLTPQQVDDIRARGRKGTSVDKLAELFHVSDTQILNILAGRQWSGTEGVAWPPSNWWAGTSVENQAAADERIPHLLKAPASVRFLSCEPLLGPVDLRPWLSELQWVIVGGESGHDARAMRVEWARDLVQQCKAAGVPVFVKQMGDVPVMSESDWRSLPASPLLSHRNHERAPSGTVPLAMASKGGDWNEWPEDLRIREFPNTEVQRCPSAS